MNLEYSKDEEDERDPKPSRMLTNAARGGSFILILASLGEWVFIVIGAFFLRDGGATFVDLASPARCSSRPVRSAHKITMAVTMYRASMIHFDAIVSPTKNMQIQLSR